MSDNDMIITKKTTTHTIDLREVLGSHLTGGYRTGPAYINGVRVWRPDAFDVANQIAHQIGRPLTMEESRLVTDVVIGGDGKSHEVELVEAG